MDRNKNIKTLLFIGCAISLIFIVILIQKYAMTMTFILPIFIFIAVHLLIFKLSSRQKVKKKRLVFLPSILILVPTLFFLGIYIRNQMTYRAHPVGGAGVMNEDFSIVFVIIGFVLLLVSFLMSFVFWFRCKHQTKVN